MTFEKWTHKIYDGSEEEALIIFDGTEYMVRAYYSGVPVIVKTYKSYTWARKSIEKYGFQLVSTRIVLGA